MKSGIYTITNLVTKSVYVGSAVNIKYRWYTHLFQLNSNTHKNTHFQNAWLKYGKDKFKMEILEYCEKANLIKREQFYIDLFLSLGMSLYNICLIAGSCLGKASSLKGKPIAKDVLQKKRNNPRIFSEEARRNISLAKQNISEETRLRMSQAKLGKPSKKKGTVQPPDVRRKISIANTGRVVSIETRQKLSAAGKGRKMSEETKLKLSLAKQNISDETRKKMSDAKKRTGIPPKSLSNGFSYGQGRIGKKASDETKLKMSLAKKKEKESRIVDSV